jgi:Putative glycerate kinase
VNISSDLLEIIRAGIDSVRPSILFPRVFANPPEELEEWRKSPDRFLLSIGKAAADSTRALLHECTVNDYFVIAPSSAPVEELEETKVHFGSHPIPDERSLNAAHDLMQWLKSLPQNGKLLVLLSGGASALMVAPAPGLSLQDKMKVNELLLKSGASIREMNVVRKHLSAVKGGRLAILASELSPVVLVLSDVIGDDLATIGSGPFFPDPSTFSEARSILEKYEIWKQIPSSACSVIESGIAGKITETPKTFNRSVPHYIVGSNYVARLAAAEKASKLGYVVRTETTEIQGMVEDVAENFTQLLKQLPARTAYIAGGEVTVRLTGNGQGGRNQHLALLLTNSLAGASFGFAAAGTDGVDGNSNAAGAWTDGDTANRARKAGLDIQKAIAEFDSSPFFKTLKQNIETGPTGTNVMDLYIGIKT